MYNHGYFVKDIILEMELLRQRICSFLTFLMHIAKMPSKMIVTISTPNNSDVSNYSSIFTHGCLQPNPPLVPSGDLFIPSHVYLAPAMSPAHHSRH